MLSHFRKSAIIEIPNLLKDLKNVEFTSFKNVKADENLKQTFKEIGFETILKLKKGTNPSKEAMTVGCLLSGGPAPGGHNVILGLYEGLKELNRHHLLIGYQEGFSGFLNGQYLELDQAILDAHRNIGGFYLLGSSRKKLSLEIDFIQAKNEVIKRKIDALVVIGGDDSNTNGAILADYFAKEKIPCHVIGVPKTIDGDLKNDYLEVSFGFDTASKVYSELIGNILNDARSAKKYYHFIKLMGRSASHLTLEAAMNTHPNFTFISEEMENRSIDQMIKDLVDMIIFRAKQGKNYGCVLIPEGLLEFIPEFQMLIKEINRLKISSLEQAKKELDEKNLQFFSLLPVSVQNQIFLERDPHGNIPLSQIQTEEVILEWVKGELSKRIEASEVKFSAITHFIGYEGRSCFPTQFDCEFTYALGKLAAIMVTSKLNAYMAGFQNLKAPTDRWEPFAIPLVSMMHLKDVKGELKPVIEKAYVDLNGQAYLEFRKSRERYQIDDEYQCPGPIQFFGPKDVYEKKPNVLNF